MSHPNGEQADQFHTPPASQPPSSFGESAAQFTAFTPTPAPEPVQPAPSVEPATQPVYSPGAASVPAVPVPVAAAPATAPAAAVPVAAVPVAAVPVPAASGYPAGYAAETGTSAYPVTGVPVSGYPVVMEPKRKRTGMIVLTVATVVLGLAAAGMGTMYLLENGKRTQAETKVSEQAAALTAADQKLKEMESKLSTSKEENAKLTQDLTGAKNKTDEVTKARDAMAACFQALDTYARSRNTATANDANAKCAEASKYY